jgi:hypothetical protein
MNLEDIDVISLEAFETSFDGVENMLPTGPVHTGMFSHSKFYK